MTLYSRISQLNAYPVVEGIDAVFITHLVYGPAQVQRRTSCQNGEAYWADATLDAARSV